MDLEDYLNGLGNDSSDLMDNPEMKIEMENYIKSLAELLKSCIQYYLDLYYVQYSPSVYKRTFGLQKSLEIDDFINISLDAQSLTINLSFNDNLSWGNSLFDGYSDGYKPILIDQGWQVNSSVWFSDIEHFGWQKGAHFIENGINEFLSEINDPNVHVILNGEVM
jgi:hypothetical protein